MWLTAPKEIKHHVRSWISSHSIELSDKAVLDFPAGNGITSQLLKDVGAKVTALDLIPEFFRVPDLTCNEGDLSKPFPVSSGSFDFIICQEGIEHVAEQLKVFEEFSRVLKPNGKLLLTTPNFSNIRSRLSYLFCESEMFGKILPPNEIDSIWHANKSSQEIYFGHIYLLGIQKLRLFSRLSGFKINRIVPTKINATSLLFFPLIYPFILFYSFASYRRALRKNGKKYASIYWDVFQWAVNPLILLDNHFVIEFERVATPEKIRSQLYRPEDTSAFVT